MKASWNDGWYHDRLLVDQLRIWQNGGARTMATQKMNGGTKMDFNILYSKVYRGIHVDGLGAGYSLPSGWWWGQVTQLFTSFYLSHFRERMVP